MMWPGHMGYYGWGGMLIGGGFLLLLFIIVIVAVVFAARSMSQLDRRRDSTYGGTPQMQDPIEILKARYARGEITREEYQEIKKELEK